MIISDYPMNFENFQKCRFSYFVIINGQYIIYVVDMLFVTLFSSTKGFFIEGYIQEV